MKSIWLHIKKTEYTCEKCGSPLYQHKLNDDVLTCMECGRKRLDDKDKQLEYRGGELAEKQGTYDALMKRSIVTDQTIRKANFDNYRTEEQETSENKEKAKQIANEYLAGNVFNTFLQGKQGTGKSHLAMSILKEINENSYPYKQCVFVDFPSLMIEVSDWKNPNNFSQTDAVKLMSEADYLVIDDLGAETNDASKAKEYIYKTLQAVMQNRQNKSTIFTSNVSSAVIGQVYGERLTSRILRGVAGHSIIFKDATDKRRIGIGF